MRAGLFVALAVLGLCFCPVPPAVGQTFGEGPTNVTFKPLEAGSVKTYYFEQSAVGREVGYAVLTLAATEHEGKKHYDYTQETYMSFRGRRSSNTIQATLSPQFVPSSVQVLRAETDKKGRLTETRHSATVEGDEIVLTSSGPNGKSTTRRVPRPSQRFVYGIAMVLEHIDYSDQTDFMLFELDPKQGTAFGYSLHVDQTAEGGREVRASWGVEGRSFYFLLGPEGELQGWGQTPKAVEVRRITENQADALRQRLKLE